MGVLGVFPGVFLKEALSTQQSALSQRTVPSGPSLITGLGYVKTLGRSRSPALRDRSCRQNGDPSASAPTARRGRQDFAYGLPLGLRLAHARKTAQIVNELLRDNCSRSPLGAMARIFRRRRKRARSFKSIYTLYISCNTYLQIFLGEQQDSAPTGASENSPARPSAGWGKPIERLSPGRDD